MKLVLCLVLIHFLEGCAYHWGKGERTMPGAYKKVYVQLFTNKTQEVGMEVEFTNALIKHIERSHLAKVVSIDQADALIQGEIRKIEINPRATRVGKNDELPNGVMLAGEYQVMIDAQVILKNKNNLKTLWEGSVNKESFYSSSQVLTQGLNTVNPIYNASILKQTVNVMAEDMMAEINDRMTENF